MLSRNVTSSAPSARSSGSMSNTEIAISSKRTRSTMTSLPALTTTPIRPLRSIVQSWIQTPLDQSAYAVPGTPMKTPSPQTSVITTSTISTPCEPRTAIPCENSCPSGW